MTQNKDIATLGVYQVFTGAGTGTGFLLDAKTLLTNCHVVEPYRTVAVEKRDQQRVIGHVRRLSPRRDLAIVQLDEPLDGEPLPIASGVTLAPKQALHILGFPIGLPLSLTEGVISNPSQLFDGISYVQTDAAINPGNSGGPMLDADWNVVAVTTCKARRADMVGFGVPHTDAHEFVQGYASQTAPFGVLCPSCEGLLETADRYCDSCGSDLQDLELESYFEGPRTHPIASFVEDGLTKANVDPVLARHGSFNWSFYSGSAPVQVWSCCSEHLCFASPLAKPGKQNLSDLFRFLLSEEHQPFAFDLAGDVIRLHLTFHMADVFSQKHDEAASLIARFTEAADRFDNLLVQKYGCTPAPKTQLTFFKEQAEKAAPIG